MAAARQVPNASDAIGPRPGSLQAARGGARWRRQKRGGSLLGASLTVAQAEGAEEAAVLVVAPLVEEAADLVHPALTLVALHPALLHLRGRV